MSILQEPIPKPHMSDDEFDESYHFALSLVPMWHRLDKDRRQQAKISILSISHNLETGTGQHHHATIPDNIQLVGNPFTHLHTCTHTPQSPPFRKSQDTSVTPPSQ